MITIVLTYYNSGGMLERHLAEWQSYAPHVKENFRAVIVDDCSEKDPAVDHMRDVGFPVELYRIKPPKIVWNTPGARNLGMDRAPDGWALITDIDHLLEADQAEHLSGLCTYRTTNFYGVPCRKWADGRPLHPHPNTYVLQRKLYWQCGGTDEDFSGYWGAGEQSFRKIIESLCQSKVELRGVTLTHFGRDDIPDASTRDWGRKGSPYDYNNNPELVKKARGPAYKPVRPLRFEWERVL